MRLIDTHTHLLLEPWKAADKEYAILSHTWGAEEIIFQEWEQLFPSGVIKSQCPHVRHTGIENKAGYHKVMQACEQAKRDGIGWLWCDTMCINKESSAELSEAINSMFKWYSEAKFCYVYLADVIIPNHQSHLRVFAGQSDAQGWFSNARNHKQDSILREMKRRFMDSRWWTRGWTLQELIAPLNVVFFAEDWTPLGSKIELAQWITARTDIHKEALEDRSTIRKFSIAQRMSWAADRTTTVVEDMAYCLLGIFEINMPMLYGQGRQAFQKLQEEIIKVSNDQSILAWSCPLPHNFTTSGALARSPADFRDCGSIVHDLGLQQLPYVVTNLGFRMTVPVIANPSQGLWFIGLNCSKELRGLAKDGNHRDESYQTRCRFPIWIGAQQTKDSVYTRNHSPKSIFHFENSYPLRRSTVTIELFISVAAHKLEASRITEQLLVDQTLNGITSTIGFGKMRKVSRAYLDVWGPSQFYVLSIGARGPLKLSHEVISSCGFTVILSVLWNESTQPHRRLHTTFKDPARQILQHISNLLAPSQNPNQLDMAHARIRSQYPASLANAQDGDPLVIVEGETWKDCHGRTEVVADVVFQKGPQK